MADSTYIIFIGLIFIIIISVVLTYPSPQYIQVIKVTEPNKKVETIENETEQLPDDSHVRWPYAISSSTGFDLPKYGRTDLLTHFVDKVGTKRIYDYDSVFDKLVPPRQRGLYDDYLDPALYPIYTSGFPTKFIKVGTLVNESLDDNNKYKFLHLIGARTNTYQFSYYAAPTSDHDTQKFPIETKKELNDGDVVFVKIIEKTYKVSIDRNAYSLFYGD